VTAVVADPASAAAVNVATAARLEIFIMGLPV
jgi:hypothetical protein